jgi:hypothetical protein
VRACPIGVGYTYCARGLSVAAGLRCRFSSYAPVAPIKRAKGAIDGITLNLLPALVAPASTTQIKFEFTWDCRAEYEDLGIH